MTITIRQPKVRDIRFQDSSICELRLIEGSNFFDLVFKSEGELHHFISDAQIAIEDFKNKQKAGMP